MNEKRQGKRQETQEPEHDRRYPEEEIIDALEEEDGQAPAAGKELAEHLGAVTGKAGGTTGRRD